MIECKHCLLPHGAATCPRCESEGIEKPYWRRIPLYRFVSARLKGEEGCRQGFLLSYSPLRIQGESGAVYECEGRPVEVVNPPKAREGEVIVTERQPRAIFFSVSKISKANGLVGFKPEGESSCHQNR